MWEIDRIWHLPSVPVPPLQFLSLPLAFSPPRMPVGDVAWNWELRKKAEKGAGRNAEEDKGKNRKGGNLPYQSAACRDKLYYIYLVFLFMAGLLIALPFY